LDDLVQSLQPHPLLYLIWAGLQQQWFGLRQLVTHTRVSTVAKAHQELVRAELWWMDGVTKPQVLTTLLCSLALLKWIPEFTLPDSLTNLVRTHLQIGIQADRENLTESQQRGQMTPLNQIVSTSTPPPLLLSTVEPILPQCALFSLLEQAQIPICSTPPQIEELVDDGLSQLTCTDHRFTN
jgi:hypothetical protein